MDLSILLERPSRTSSPDHLRNAILPSIRPDSRPEEGYNSKNEKTINRTAKQGEGSTKSFACPFYKHDPIKYGAYQDKRKCDRIGWADISRLKEHLTRSHTQKTYCPRCWEEFSAVDGLYKHTAFACMPRPGRPPDGITHDILRKLRSRSKTSRLQSDHEKWVEIYRMLFPSRQHVPSPYFEKPQGKVLVRLEDHEEFMRMEFRRLVDSRLETKEGWKDLGNLKRILDECLDEALMGYRKKSGLDFYDDADVCSSDRTPTTQISETPLSIFDQTDFCYATDGAVPRDETTARHVCDQCCSEDTNCICRHLAGVGSGMYMSESESPWTPLEDLIYTEKMH